MVIKQIRGLLLMGLTLCALLISPAFAQNATGVDQATAYVRTQQQPDGSFAGFGPGSTADAIFALAAANVNVDEVAQGGTSALDYVQAQAKGSGKDTGVAAKFLIAVTLAGQSPRLADGTDLVGEVAQGYNAQTGQYGQDVTSHAYAMIGLVAAGATPEAAAIDALKKLQLPDGGWSFDGTAATGSDTNTTGLVIQALKAAGDTSDAVGKAVAYLKAQQNNDGGFPYSQASSFGNASDANSTALAIQGLLAAGEDLANYVKDGKSPTDRLLQFQNPSGAFRYQDAQPDDNVLATYQAIPALQRVTLPLRALPVAPPAASAAPSATASPAPTAAPSAAPSAAPAGGPAALPNTGANDRAWMLALAATLAVSLIAGGVLMVRRRA